ncbi:MAG: Type 1 glutamine amidotransferase-like domain-containing protein [Erysipelotrichaceae bacterium]|nr:Type 1 glutamine amidotransferase-like domain-containing protein [Erysipelotrichaceae bacterium]
MINVLLSFYDIHKSWAQDIIKPLLHADMKVLYIPFSFAESDMNNHETFEKCRLKHNADILTAFHYYDITDIDYIDYFLDNHITAVEKIQNADVIFFTGGFPDQYLVRLNEFDIVDTIRNSDKLIIGASAGAMVQLDNYHITPDDDYPEYQYQDGLGLVSGFEIEVHYCHSDIQEAGLKRVIKEKQLPTYTIPNDGGLLVKDNQIIPFGSAALVQ